MLTFEEWRHAYADVFETDDAARAAWTAASNNGYRAGAQDTRTLLAAHSVGAQAYPTIDHWLTELAGEREIGHVIQEMTHMEVARQAWAAARAMTDSAGVQEPVAEIVRWLDFTNKPRFDIKVIDETIEHGTKLYTHPQPMPQTDASRHLSDLLARIHRDGGQYEAEHGIDKAVADADDKVARLNAMTDVARDAKDAKRYRLLRERHFVRADNPNTSAYHCVGIFTSWLPAATIDRDGLDAVLDAEIERLDRAKEPK